MKKTILKTAALFAVHIMIMALAACGDGDYLDVTIAGTTAG